MLPSSGHSEEDKWALNYITGDLFSCPEDEALAHCISEDCRMGAGIAVMFKRKFNGVHELKQQRESNCLFTPSEVGTHSSRRTQSKTQFDFAFSVAIKVFFKHQNLTLLYFVLFIF